MGPYLTRTAGFTDPQNGLAYGTTALAAMISSGHVRPIVGARFPLEDAAEALKLIDGRGATGKVVLDVSGS